MSIASRLDGARRSALGYLAATAALRWITAAAGVLALFAMVLGQLRWIALPKAVPFVAWGVVVLAALVMWRWGRGRVRRDTAPARVAATVEHERGLRGGALRAALEVADTGALGALAASRAAALLEGHRVLAPRWTQLLQRGLIQASAGALVALVAAVIASRTAPDGWAAAWHPLRAARGTLLPAIRIAAPPMVVRGSLVALGLTAPSRRTLSVRWRTTGASWRDTVVALRDGRAILDMGRGDADMLVVAGDGRASSDTVSVRVVERPYLGDLLLRARYPEYLGRSDEALAPGEPVRVPRGTAIEMSAVASVTLDRVALVRGRDTQNLRLSSDGARVSGSLIAQQSGVWSWMAMPRDAGPAPELPAVIALEVMPDSAPGAAIIAPGRDTTVTLGQKLPVTVAAMDDHGLAQVVLIAWRRPAKGGEEAPVTETLAVTPGPAWSETFGLDVAARGLEPGDAVRLVIEATDASPWKQRTRSRELVVRVPALSEQRSMARNAADTAAAAAFRAAAQQRALEKRTADEARDAKKAAEKGEGKMSFDQAEKARALAADQRKMAEKAQQVGDAAQQLERQLKQAGALDSALAQRLREVQNLMKDAMTPEMAERLKKLENAASQLSQDQAQQQLGQMQQDQKKMREQLERSAQLLQRAALEGAMQTLKDEAKELAAREQAMADSLGKTSKDAPRDTAAAKARADKLAERAEQFEKDVAKLRDRLQKEKAAAGASGASKAAEQAKQSAEAMKEAAKGAGKSPGEASKDARSGAEAMQQAAQDLAQGRQQQINEWKKDIADELDRASQEMQQMAQQQQQLAQQAQAGGDQQGMKGDQSALQQGAEQMGERLGAQAKSSSLVSQRSQRAVADAQRKMAEAGKKLGEKGSSSKEAGEAMKEASDALQQAASSLAKDRDRVNTSPTGSGFSDFLEELQRAAQQQGNASKQAQQLMQLPAGSKQRADGMRQLAKQQREVARSLDEAGANDATGKADAMAKEARALADRLEQGGADNATLQRQQQLFRRLLDAGKSLEQNERDDTGKREARAGAQDRLFTPGSQSARGAAAAAPTAAELKALSTDERRLVGEYFRRLNATPPR